MEFTNEAMIVLESFMSAPGARQYVTSYIRDLSDSEIDEIYNTSEGANDTETEAAVNALNDEQREAMIRDLIDINMEYKDGCYADDYEECYGEAGRIVDRWLISRIAL